MSQLSISPARIESFENLRILSNLFSQSLQRFQILCTGLETHSSTLCIRCSNVRSFAFLFSFFFLIPCACLPISFSRVYSTEQCCCPRPSYLLTFLPACLPTPLLHVRFISVMYVYRRSRRHRVVPLCI